MKNYYEILRIPEDAPKAQIKKAYIMLAKRYHPDVQGDDKTDIFSEIVEAYETLSDDQKKEAYDEKLKKFNEGIDIEKQQREEKFHNMMLRGRRKIKEGNYIKAFEYLDKVKEHLEYTQQQLSPEFMSWYAYTMFKLGRDRKKAIEMMDRAVTETMFGDQELMLNLAECLFESGSNALAKDVLKRAIPLNIRNKRAARIKLNYDSKSKNLFERIFRRK